LGNAQCNLLFGYLKSFTFLKKFLFESFYFRRKFFLCIFFFVDLRFVFQFMDEIDLIWVSCNHYILLCFVSVQCSLVKYINQNSLIIYSKKIAYIMLLAFSWCIVITLHLILDVKLEKKHKIYLTYNSD
jgi:hypothetical protein